jgi:hypothetical protein
LHGRPSLQLPTHRQEAWSPEILHAMPSAPVHAVLRSLARHHISPAQKARRTRCRGATRGYMWDRC